MHVKHVELEGCPLELPYLLVYDELVAADPNYGFDSLRL